MSERTVEKEVLKGLGNRTAKARSTKVITKRSQPSSSVENAVSNLPGEVDNLTVSIKGEKFPPRSRPIKDTERRKELRDTVRGT